MAQIFLSLDAPELNTQNADWSALSFVDEAEYEFVGGGNAVNGL